MRYTDPTQIRALGELKAAGYTHRSLKDELRDNLVLRLKAGMTVFDGIHGYAETVIPDLERAILSRHNILLLGLRGQAKTRLARQMTSLLDEWVPVVQGSELNEDPFHPLMASTRTLLEEAGDDTPITWLHRDDRYAEKLATPDVSVADLIGDVDPIKAANMRLAYSDERVIHFGIIPRSHRCIFVINELPDLQARIQVALFNILQEGDIQIRGFRLRLPLDIQFVFTANPEDYTNRGSIVTPLKDRIGSQILTHYPKDLETGLRITQQEARPAAEALARVTMPPLLSALVEQVALEARSSEFVDQKSGVSARLTLSAWENLVSTAERRALRNRETHTRARIGDLWGIIPAITGKVELVYEGEQEGPQLVAQNLLEKAIRTQFAQYFPAPDKLRRKTEGNPYAAIVRWFGQGNALDLLMGAPDATYANALRSVNGLEEMVRTLHPQADDTGRLLLMELALYGMAAHSLIGRSRLENGQAFTDLLSGMLSGKGGRKEGAEEADED